MRIAEAIGEYKKEKNITILQLDRWREILKTRSVWTKEAGLSKDFTEKYLEQLHKESIRTQTKVMNSNRSSLT
jgi:chorismate mutase